jgi:hypothetical protein
MSRRSISLFKKPARLASLATALGIFALAACSAPPDPSSFGSGSKSKVAGSDPTGTFGDGASNNTTGPGGTTTAACVPNKANAEIPGNGCDDDADGTVDNAVTCDGALAGDSSAEDFARTMGICQTAAKNGYGLVSAKFTRGYGREDLPKVQQHGVLSKFGNVLKPREGGQLGVLSTGYAQEFDGSPGANFGGDSNGVDWFNSQNNPGNGTAPPGYPKPADTCPIASGVNDLIDLRLELKAPPNATGIKFDFNFHSGEWPVFICSPFNDGFIAYLSAKGFNNGTPENISFDSKNNPVSVNNGFFDRCTAGAQTGCDPRAKPGVSTCPGGAGELAGTGFGNTGQFCPGGGTSVSGGATGWLSSQAPVTAGETFTLDLMIWDTGDGELDSSVLLDNFQWVGGKVVVTSTGRPTGPN